MIFYFYPFGFLDDKFGENTHGQSNETREQTESNESELKFFEVDAFGDDYVDFGASTGSNGAFVWHASFPLE